MRLRQVILVIIGFAAASFCAALLSGSVTGILRVTAQQNLPASSQQPPEQTAMPPADIALPYEVAGTNLIAEQLVQYEGAYMEDGSYDEVVNVAALLLRNCGDTVIADAWVKLQRGELQLMFEISFLPPGTAMLVLEKDRKTCLSGNYTGCSGLVLRELPALQSQEISVSVLDRDTLCVENRASIPLNSVTLYYKTVYGSGSFYLGGITHHITLEHLMPGQTAELRPEYYSSIGSEVVYIVTA